MVDLCRVRAIRGEESRARSIVEHLARGTDRSGTALGFPDRIESRGRGRRLTSRWKWNSGRGSTGARAGWLLREWRGGRGEAPAGEEKSEGTGDREVLVVWWCLEKAEAKQL